MNGIFHKKGNVDRLYLRRNLGGRGLLSVEDCVRTEEANLYKYIRENPDLLICAANEVLHCKETRNEETESGLEYKKRVTGERIDRITEKKMHGKFFREVAEFASPRSFEWLSSSFIHKNTEGFIFAAQEQVLPTNWLRARIGGEGVDNKCRECGKEVETVGHLASGCGKLAQLEYRKRHDRMGLKVYWELCKKYGIKCGDKWYEECPDKVRISECGDYEIWWDRSVETPQKLEHNKPDVVLIDRKLKHWDIVDFSVPNDRNVEKKEAEKITKYTDLAKEVRKMHKVSTRIIPLIVGALGIVSNSLSQNLKKLKIPDVSRSMQVSAVLGTSIILSKVLKSEKV